MIFDMVNSGVMEAREGWRNAVNRELPQECFQ
jgi:hypothetical protein